MRGDLHEALKTDVVGSKATQEVDLRVVRLQHGKDDVDYTLHARPVTLWTAGVQVADALSLMGFRASDRCTFFYDRCLVRRVAPEFSADAFAAAFSPAFAALRDAADSVGACGLAWDEGRRARGGRGDGHSAQKIQKQKESENEHFRFVLTWIDGAEKGWTNHYIPKHPPVSPEMDNVLGFLGVQRFSSCPEHDFEPCHWRFVPFQQQSRTFMGSNVEVAYSSFDSHAARFSIGVEKLLWVNRTLVPFGMEFLPASSPSRSQSSTPAGRAPPSPPRSAHGIPEHFDVALSFAGPERRLAEALAGKARAAGLEVFYDDFYPEQLWGKNLVDFFDEIYRKRASRCVIFISKDYLSREWTNHERQSAQARALREKGKEYILPIQVDESELPGMAPTIGYLSLKAHTIDQVAEVLIKKLRG